jgi:hypothetical protein
MLSPKVSFAEKQREKSLKSDWDGQITIEVLMKLEQTKNAAKNFKTPKRWNSPTIRRDADRY